MIVGVSCLLQSLQELLRCSVKGDNSEAVNYAIQVVAQAGDAGLTNILVDYLMGEPDGYPKVCPFNDPL